MPSADKAQTCQYGDPTMRAISVFDIIRQANWWSDPIPQIRENSLHKMFIWYDQLLSVDVQSVSFIHLTLTKSAVVLRWSTHSCQSGCLDCTKNSAINIKNQHISLCHNKLCQLEIQQMPSHKLSREVQKIQCWQTNTTNNMLLHKPFSTGL